ncbi:DUF2252 domain-containing protein [Pseudonocardia xinjiangensis]|uniref:DUF2252 domain-containing protein n=1 Tax=Pseudonocardia xinjiangensis TaxID=75289 RepID=A0ABX1RIU5_9PSEU|nr:DUF2252 domain-containing protein [Pseudonocardia xinjiangensis]NMH79121.1 DUF2252 domain-containing protein [Pseudonocardia xinjiangensis]
MATTAPERAAAEGIRPPSVAECVDRGRAARVAAPRSAHDRRCLAGPRPDPVEVLAEQDGSREPDLLPIRYGRMAASPSAFFRGAAAVMACDLAGSPVSGIDVQLCGDAHLSNFGFFGSPERRLVFDINDFDETLRGPWEWDVKRLITSLEVAGRDRGFRAADRRQILRTAAREYQRAMHSFAGMPTLEVWYARADVEEIRRRYESQLAATGRKRLARGLAKARTRDNLGALRRFTSMKDGRLRLVAEPPLVVPVRDLYPDVAARSDLERDIDELLRSYRASLPPERRALYDQYRPVDVARKVVGVGSVGTRSWMILFLGRDAGDPLFLQAKEATASVLEPYLGAAEQPNHAERVVVGQRLMQTVGDILLGWQRVSGVDGQERDFYLRQLRDWKGSVEVEEMVPAGMRIYAQLCAWTLARAHARTGDRIAIAAYLGSSKTFADAVTDFAQVYADRNERDHALLLKAIAAARVPAELGV